jgi:hypothetical protein
VPDCVDHGAGLPEYSGTAAGSADEMSGMLCEPAYIRFFSAAAGSSARGAGLPCAGAAAGAGPGDAAPASSASGAGCASCRKARR